MFITTKMFGNDRIKGGSGDDQLWGDSASHDAVQGGQDVFVFAPGFGRDTIHDFEAGPGQTDVIEFEGVNGIDAFSDLISKMTDDGYNTTIAIDDENSILLKNVVVSQLDADDFRFA